MYPCKKRNCPDLCGGTVRVIEQTKCPCPSTKMDEHRLGVLKIIPLVMLLIFLPWLISIPPLVSCLCSQSSFCPGPVSSFFSPPDFGGGWMSLMARQGQNLSTQVSIIKRLCSMCPPSCLTQKATHSRYSDTA